MTTRTLIVHSHEQEIAKKIAQEIQASGGFNIDDYLNSIIN